MRTVVRRALCAGAFGGGFRVLGIALATSPASAADQSSTSGESGLQSGNQTAAQAEAVVEATGNQVTVIGEDNSNTESSEEEQPGTGAEEPREDSDAPEDGGGETAGPGSGNGSSDNGSGSAAGSRSAAATQAAVAAGAAGVLPQTGLTGLLALWLALALAMLGSGFLLVRGRRTTQRGGALTGN